MAATFQYSPRPPGMMVSHSSWPRYRNPLDSCSAMPITGPYFKVSVMIGVTIVDSSVSGVRSVCAVPAGGQHAASAVDLKRNAIAQCHHINESWYTALDCRIRSSLSLCIKPYLRTSPTCVPGSSLYLSWDKALPEQTFHGIGQYPRLAYNSISNPSVQESTKTIC